MNAGIDESNEIFYIYTYMHRSIDGSILFATMIDRNALVLFLEVQIVAGTINNHGLVEGFALGIVLLEHDGFLRLLFRNL